MDGNADVTWPDRQARELMSALFYTAVEAVSAERCLAGHLQSDEMRKATALVAIGKAAAAMAAAATKELGALPGIVVIPPGHGVRQGDLGPCIKIIEAGHPVPNQNSETAAKEIIAFADQLGSDDTLLALISGGGSALAAWPVAGVSLKEKQELTKQLLRSGATIEEINCVRKKLSQIKGGRLAKAAAPAQIQTVVISDIPGDDPALIASGPTVPDQGSVEEARAILQRYDIAPAASIEEALSTPAKSKRCATQLQTSPIIVARAKDMLEAAARLSSEHGFKVINLGDKIEGEASLIGAQHADLALGCLQKGEPHLILSGGETTVTVRNRNGRGGRNLEYLLGLAIALDGTAGIWAIACDTDGIDGTEDNAGAVIAPDTLARAEAVGLDAREALRMNGAYGFFASLGDLIITGPTRTNVNDFRAILIAHDWTNG